MYAIAKAPPKMMEVLVLVNVAMIMALASVEWDMLEMTVTIVTMGIAWQILQMEKDHVLLVLVSEVCCNKSFKSIYLKFHFWDNLCFWKFLFWCCSWYFEILRLNISWTFPIHHFYKQQAQRQFTTPFQI